MKPIWPHLLRILVLAGLWGLGGYFIGLAVETMFDLSYTVGLMTASLNLILGMMLFLGITRDSISERIFFEGPKPNEDGLPQIGCLWLMPLTLILIGVWWLLVAIFVRFIFPP